MKVQRALISVSNKEGLVDFAAKLANLKINIISTGGTAKTLRENGLASVNVSDFTGFPEILDGRVKTLHPKIHGGILFRRDNPEDLKTIEAQGIVPIDLVVVNLYPFEKAILKPEITLDEAIEEIDIGGPTLLRAAAKNFKHVIVVVEPSDYNLVIEELTANDNTMSEKVKLYLAAKVFHKISMYDHAICEFLIKLLERRPV